MPEIYHQMLDRMTLLFRLKAIVEAGSLRKASEVLNVTQPALSRTVARLEQYFGQPLLERSTRGVTPNAFGGRVLASVQRLARHWEIAEQELKTSGADVSGRLLIHAGPLWRAVVLPKLIGKLQKTFPQLLIELHNLESERNLVDLMEGRCDMIFGGIRIEDAPDRRLAIRQFTTVRDVVVAREDHPLLTGLGPRELVAPRSLLDYPWLVYTANSVYVEATIHAPLERIGHSPNICITCESLISAIGLLQNSDCLCILPDAAVAGTHNPSIVPVPVSLSRRQIGSGAIYRQEMEDWPPVRELIRLCQERFDDPVLGN